MPQSARIKRNGPPATVEKQLAGPPDDPGEEEEKSTANEASAGPRKQSCGRLVSRVYFKKIGKQPTAPIGDVGGPLLASQGQGDHCSFVGGTVENGPGHARSSIPCVERGAFARLRKLLEPAVGDVVVAALMLTAISQLALDG